MARALPRCAWRTVTWPEGVSEPLSSRFARVRVHAAHRDQARGEEWLTIEWAAGTDEPAHYWFSNLPRNLPWQVMIDTAMNLGKMLLWWAELVPASRMLESAVLIRPDHVPSLINLCKAYYLSGLAELAIAGHEEVLRLDPSNAIALNNLLLLADAAGNRAAATAYRRRLEALGSGRATEPQLADRGPITQLSTRPPVAAAVGSPSPTVDAVKPLPLTDKDADALGEMIRDLRHVKVERRGGRITVTGYTSGPKERAMLNRIIGIAATPLVTPPPSPVSTPKMGTTVVLTPATPPPRHPLSLPDWRSSTRR